MPPKGSGKEKVVEEEEEVVQAVVLADSFNSRFAPLSTNKPRALLPLCNRPLLDWTIEALVSSGIHHIFVFCCSHAEQVKAAINEWLKNTPNMGIRITPIVTPEARSVGDVMRELDAKQIVTADFVLVTGDIVSNLDIMKIVDEHKARRRVSKNCIMSMVMKPASPRDKPRHGIDHTALLLNSQTQECLYYEYLPDGTQRIALPREKIKAAVDLDARIDLLHCSIDICSVDVPALFTENFDYQDLRVDFVHGVLTSDILGKTIFCHIPTKGYASRVKDTKAYLNITHDVLSRRAFPLVPDDSPDYPLRRGDIYIADPASIARTAELGSHTQIGPQTQIQDYAEISSTVIGARCKVGPYAQIRNSVIWDDVEIGEGVVIIESIIANGVKIGEGSRVERGCLIGSKVVLGTDAKLSQFEKLSAKNPYGDNDDDDDWDEDDDDYVHAHDHDEYDPEQDEWRIVDTKIIGNTEDGETPLAVWRWPGESAHPDDDDEDEGAEKETIRSRRFNQIGQQTSVFSRPHRALLTRSCVSFDCSGVRDVDLGRFDRASVASSTPESTPDASPTSSLLTLSDEESEEEEDGEDDSEDEARSSASKSKLAALTNESSGGYSDAEFKYECTQSLDRAFEEGHTVENAAIELKTLRMASNVPIDAVREVIVAFLVGKVPLDSPDVKKAATAMIARWGGLLGAIGSEKPSETLLILQNYCIAHPDRSKLFSQVLVAFYNQDIVEEDDVKAWILDKRAKHAVGSPGEALRTTGLLFLRQLSEEDEEDDDDDDDEEDEGEDDEDSEE
ncbi:nucleotide-diphospho-sugar transferase [Clavulina sp. PMI_390]|nr:nucleotide-diphospho-sugar transferase [Clavulina sp. PMI_390]